MALSSSPQPTSIKGRSRLKPSHPILCFLLQNIHLLTRILLLMPPDQKVILTRFVPWDIAGTCPRPDA